MSKARRKVLDQELAGRDLTRAMNDTPRDRLRQRAYRGRWADFPISPAASCELFESVIASERGSFATAMELETYAGIPWRDTGIEPRLYWSDLCEPCIWEDWGIRYRREATPFRNARRSS